MIKGLFLKDNKITAMPLRFNNQGYINEQGKPYANQLWLGGLAYVSHVGGSSRSLDYDRARGVLSHTAGSGTQKLPYTNRRLDRVIKIADGVRKGDIKASQLEKIVSFLEGFRKD